MEVQSSHLRRWSVGIVAENKALDSNEIEVLPIEALNLMDGELGSGRAKVGSSGVDSEGRAYQVEVDMSVTLRASWLGETNRATPPDVRRGEQVWVWRQGDADKFYWTSMGRDDDLRRLETVIYRFSGLPDNVDEEIDEDNSYYLEISTHAKMLTLKTSKRNGEFCRYTVQMDTDHGQVMLLDDVGNEFQLDSRNTLIHMQNADGTFLDLDKTNINGRAPETWFMKAKDMIFESETFTQNTTKTALWEVGQQIDVTAPTINQTGTFNQTGAFNLAGAMTAAAGPGGGSGITLTGDMILNGRMDATVDVTANGVSVVFHDHDGDSGGKTSPPNK